MISDRDRQMNYITLLNQSHELEKEIQCEFSTKYEFLASVFDFTTYDADMDELFVKKALAVCKSITKRTTFEFIKDEDNYKWYLMILNLPFFSSKIEWGCSIRGAWWDHGGFDLDVAHWAHLQDENITFLEFKPESWAEFLSAVEGFLAEDDAPNL